MSKVTNKWNGGTYEVVSDEGTKITLKRDNGTLFTIAKTDFNFCYYKKEKRGNENGKQSSNYI